MYKLAEVNGHTALFEWNK